MLAPSQTLTEERPAMKVPFVFCPASQGINKPLIQGEIPYKLETGSTNKVPISRDETLSQKL